MDPCLGMCFTSHTFVLHHCLYHLYWAISYRRQKHLSPKSSQSPVHYLRCTLHSRWVPLPESLFHLLSHRWGANYTCLCLWVIHSRNHSVSALSKLWFSWYRASSIGPLWAPWSCLKFISTSMYITARTQWGFDHCAMCVQLSKRRKQIGASIN